MLLVALYAQTYMSRRLILEGRGWGEKGDVAELGGRGTVNGAEVKVARISEHAWREVQWTNQ